MVTIFKIKDSCSYNVMHSEKQGTFNKGHLKKQNYANYIAEFRRLEYDKMKSHCLKKMIQRNIEDPKSGKRIN